MVWHTEDNGQMVTFPEYLIVPDNETENLPDDETENLPDDETENLPADEPENEFASDTQSAHSIDSHNIQTEPFDDNDA